MTQIQVAFYSMYGHVYEMAKEVANGVLEVAGTHVDLYQVQVLIPDDPGRSSLYRTASYGGWRGQRRNTVRGIHSGQSGRIQMAFRQ